MLLQLLTLDETIIYSHLLEEWYEVDKKLALCTFLAWQYSLSVICASIHGLKTINIYICGIIDKCKEAKSYGLSTTWLSSTTNILLNIICLTDIHVV